jgi:hypothetical protein
MIVHAHGGLANRLRVIFSYRDAHGPITVAWVPDGQVHHERFSDVFEPIRGVEFIDRPPSGAVSTCDPCPAITSGLWQRGYLELKPIVETPCFDEPYAAMHMRRTDAIVYQLESRAYEPDATFITWALDNDLPIFLATDNAETQFQMRDYLIVAGKRVLTHGLISENNEADHRNTSLLRAWHDVETCVRAERFRGSGVSSFTNLIHTLRGMR